MSYHDVNLHSRPVADDSAAIAYLSAKATLDEAEFLHSIRPDMEAVKDARAAVLEAHILMIRAGRA